jgi:hypothetical protein
MQHIHNKELTSDRLEKTRMSEAGIKSQACPNVTRTIATRCKIPDRLDGLFTPIKGVSPHQPWMVTASRVVEFRAINLYE